MLVFSYLHCRDVDYVCDLMGDIGGDQEIANEISDAISHPLGVDADDEVTLRLSTMLFVICMPHRSYTIVTS